MLFRLLLSAFLLAAVANAERELGPHDYDIALSSATAAMGQGQANQFTITFTHDDISGAALSGAITDYATCASTANTNGLSVGTISFPDSNPGTAIVDVDFSALDLGTAVWDGDGGDSSVLDFCYTLTATVSGEAVANARVKVSATIDLTNDTWSVASIDVTDDSPETATAINTDIEYTLTSYECDDSYAEITTPVAFNPGDAVQICVLYTGGEAGIGVLSFKTVTMTQTTGGVLTTVSAGTIQHSFTTVNCDGGLSQKCRIKTNIIRNYFTADTEDITIAGTVLMKVGRRLVEVPMSSNLRRAQEPSSEGYFETTVAFNNPEASGSCRALVPLATAGLAALVALV